MKNNTSSYFKCSMLTKSKCSPDILFGPTEFANEICWLYNDRKLKKGATIIWVPKHKVHIALSSYLDAIKNNDREALGWLRVLGIPTDLNFGITDCKDYTIIKKADGQKKRQPVIKTMKVEYGGTTDDGKPFKPGDMLVIHFRKWFDGIDSDGNKRFRNGYMFPEDAKNAV